MMSAASACSRVMSPEVQRLAGALGRAERAVTPIEPLTSQHAGLTVEDAYDIQLVNAHERCSAGVLVRGYKVGLTAKRMQEIFGIAEPDFGHLFSDMFAYEGQELSLNRFIAPKVEVEPAFILGRPLRGPHVTIADVIRATEWIVPAIEVIDSRIRDWRIKLVDTIADNGSSAAVVLAGAPRRLADLDLRGIDVALFIEDELRQTGTTRQILGNPITAVAWLANKLAERGIEMEPGQVILPGTCVAAEDITSPATVRGDLSELGTVEFAFV